tara:strand:+ start:390 stop:719 length:330 start_codon:yes stop_codon:yes gene_type:complete
MKEITLPYSEYESMVSLIKEQDNALYLIKKHKGAVVIDSRCNYCRSEIDRVLYSIPKIIGEDEAKAFLKEEFDRLYEDVFEMREEYASWKHHNKSNAAKKKETKRWWEV